MQAQNNIKPFIKWVGGKTQIINNILSEFPKNIDNYYEIFLGGGSVLFSLLENIRDGNIKLSGNIYAYDINEVLINIYLNIQKNPQELYTEIKKLVDEYNNIEEVKESKEDKEYKNSDSLEEAKESKEKYYYWIRKQYNQQIKINKKSILICAMFIFLNKTCFRGVYRMGPNGFNVPFGNYKNPEIVNKEHILKISDLIKNVVFECRDFRHSLEQKFNKNDFIYLDPPYYPEKKTSFVKYSENGFNNDDHESLFNTLVKTKTKFVMSNSNVKYVLDFFNNDKYNIKSVLCKRTINSKNPESKTTEIIISRK